MCDMEICFHSDSAIQMYVAVHMISNNLLLTRLWLFQGRYLACIPCLCDCVCTLCCCVKSLQCFVFISTVCMTVAALIVFLMSIAFGIFYRSRGSVTVLIVCVVA